MPRLAENVALPSVPQSLRLGRPSKCSAVTMARRSHHARLYSRRDALTHTFCTRYSEWANALPLTLRQTHAPGEKLFVDYSGDKVAIVNADTGEIREAELFVAVLGASNYTYAEATWTQQSSDWIGSHVRAFEFMGGCPEIVTPDNLKSGVHKPSFYDPIINRTYGEMASHYSVAVIPARSKKPRDKA
ncbi:integrase catalytic region [Caballeronia terrestris]|uniref:Integrase catalytic region n=1 Tax=Caballeronia terrestris TaxID=1226301 RepID=A0A158KYG0_9BURK|nr:integrase catalytic region [Caballeronia terrestris]